MIQSREDTSNQIKSNKDTSNHIKTDHIKSYHIKSYHVKTNPALLCQLYNLPCPEDSHRLLHQ